MTIRLRVILGFLLTIVVMAAGTLPFMLKTMRDNAEESYLANATTQLLRSLPIHSGLSP